MITKSNYFHFRIWATVSVTVVLSSLLLWQYFHGGIPSHYFLADKNMPLVSNVWGALIIPIMTWFLLYRTGKRLFSESDSISFPGNTLIGFSCALVFAVTLGLSIQYRFETFSENVPFLLFGLALFFPTYRAEYFLGFILGLTYFVGGVLPVVVGSVFLMISAAIYLFLRPLILKLVKVISNWMGKK